MLRYRTLAAIIVLLGFGTAIHAQTPVDIGFKGGLSIPNLTGGNSDNPISHGYSSTLGPTFGIFAEFHLSNAFSIQPELKYITQGGKKNGDQAFTVPSEYAALLAAKGINADYLYATYKGTAKFHYLMLPILAKFHIMQKSDWDIYAAAGPFASLLVSAHYVTKDMTSGGGLVYLDAEHSLPLPIPAMSFDNKENIKNQIHKFNTGIDGYVGVGYHLKRSTISLEAGGNYGFLNIQKDAVNGKNNIGAATITLGYAYALHQ